MTMMMKMVLITIQTVVLQKAMKKAIILMMTIIIMLIMKKTPIRQTRNKKRKDSVTI